MSIAFALIALVAGTIGTFVFGIYASCVTVVCVVLSIIFAVTIGLGLIMSTAFIPSPIAIFIDYN